MRTEHFSYYLKTITKAVNALSGAIVCGELSVDTLLKVLTEMKELEETTADFITELELTESVKEAVAACKRRFIYSNNYVIKCLEKIQSQGYDFSEYITALKLENETLKEEISFL